MVFLQNARPMQQLKQDDRFVKRADDVARIERNAAIIKAARNGAPFRSLGRKYGISFQAVSAMCRKAGIVSKVRQRLLESGAAKRTVAEERRAAAAVRRNEQKEKREREMEAVRRLVEDEGISALAALKRLGLSRNLPDNWRCQHGFRLDSLHGPGSRVRKGKPGSIDKVSIKVEMPDRQVATGHPQRRGSPSKSPPSKSSPSKPQIERIVIAVDEFPTFSRDERKRLAIQRHHINMAGRRRKVTIEELQAAVQASDKPVQRLPLGAHSGWLPSWLA